ncbi:hypothetical protein [Nocardia blacklockiae]|uniref:hypothetical protein n=1 Tax=Nocardia blacklockiae TaxID=480036 RepID=UPI001893F716|nr:hypothetical protein [Nocardia blacklockiae]MBF6171122.1 hypothetical protein [Nocardia blacklockiae]
MTGPAPHSPGGFPAELAIHADTPTPTSGFLEADLQLAIDQYQTLSQDLRETDPALLTTLNDRINEVEQRIETLLTHPALTTHGTLVHQRLDAIDSDPATPRAPLFTPPSPAAIEQHAQAFTEMPVPATRDRHGRDVDDALRLYQLTARIADSPQASTAHQAHARRTLADQRRHLERRVTGHPQLNVRERQAALDALTVVDTDWRIPLPNYRFEALSPETGAVDPSFPLVDLAPGTDLAIRFTDPGDPRRELALGIEGGHWIARTYTRYAGHPQWVKPEMAAGYTSADHMLRDLAHGTEYPRPGGGVDVVVPPIQIPADVTAKIGELRSRQNLSTHSAPTANLTSAPPPKPRPAASRQRRTPLRPPSAGLRRKTLGH